MAEKTWTYGNYEIREGLKPGSRHFQYFYVVSEKGEKKCNYCVWIDDENLPHFSPTKEFEKIVSSREGEWSKWAKEKIDARDFRNRVLKIERSGPREIDLTDMDKAVKPE
jgi:hypothetical protein